MKELSLNVLDITQNSITAGAAHIDISLIEDDSHVLTVTVKDDGCGMTPEILERVTNPFYTTRKTRKVGLGLPLLRLAAEQAGGELKIVSKTADADPENHGTTVTATFHTDSIDFTPVGDMASTICVIIQGHPEIEYTFRHKTPKFDVRLDTAGLRKILGNVSLAEPEVLEWISGYLADQYNIEK
jgi:hypothetical protein